MWASVQRSRPAAPNLPSWRGVGGRPARRGSTPTHSSPTVRGGRAVVWGVRRQTEFEVGVYGVRSRGLQLVGLQLVQQAYAASFVAADVEHHSASLAGDLGQSGIQLWTTVTAQRAEDVAGQALG